METLVIMLGIFFGAQDVEVTVIHVYGHGSNSCVQDAEEMQRKAGPQYRFWCEPISFTKT